MALAKRDAIDEKLTEMYFDKPVAPKGIKVYNPSFDVTPADMLTGIITEKGIISPHDLAKLRDDQVY